MLYPIELLGRTGGSMLASLGSFVMLAASPMHSSQISENIERAQANSTLQSARNSPLISCKAHDTAP